MTFSELGLNSWLSKRCDALGYTSPTPIQEKAIPTILNGDDIIGCASTGTGKTAAFLLPLLHNLREMPPALKKKRMAKALIIAPTRELAIQIGDNLQKLDNKGTAVVLVGGTSIDRQIRDLRKRPEIIIATPGRLLDHVERETVNLSKVDFLVLDEADRMLDMGFWPAIRQIISITPESRQTLLFSATMLPAIEELARTKMKDPVITNVNRRGVAAATINQTVYPVALESKTNLLFHLLEENSLERVLVFTRTRRGAERLSHMLSAREHRVNRIHAERTQPQRQAALNGFKTGKYQVLVATDVAARGIDVDLVSHVINYDLPDAPEDYVHRIGRTGRAGNEGTAISLVTPVDELSMVKIEKLIGQKIERILIAEFGGKNIPQPKPAASRPTRSFRERRPYGARR